MNPHVINYKENLVMGYKKILLALSLDYYPRTYQSLITKAKGLMIEKGVELYLVHAVEHISSYGFTYGVSVGVDVENLLLEKAKTSIKEIASGLDVPLNRQIVKISPAKFLILDQAGRLGVDLILLGSHGRHGIQLLLGSTAKAVLHGAQCDVLVLRLKG